MKQTHRRNHNKHLVNSEEANILTDTEIQRVNAAICFLDNCEQHPVEEKKHRKGLFNEIGGRVYMTKVTQRMRSNCTNVNRNA